MPDRGVEELGKRIVAERLVSGNFGNYSIRAEDGFRITRTGAYLDSPGALVFIPDSGPVPADASREWRVHAAIYRRTAHAAVLHAHPPHAVAASFAAQTVVLVDSEGQLPCPVIPVVAGEPGSDDLAGSVAEALKTRPIVISRGHGTFAGGSTLEEAYLVTSAAEHSCRILHLLGKLAAGKR